VATPHVSEPMTPPGPARIEPAPRPRRRRWITRRRLLWIVPLLLVLGVVGWKATHRGPQPTGVQTEKVAHQDLKFSAGKHARVAAYFVHPLAGAPWPLVLASDVLYEARNGEQLLALLPRLTAAGGEVWLADPGRMTTAGFLDPAAASWRIDAIPHDGPSHVIVHRLRPRAAP